MRAICSFLVLAACGATAFARPAQPPQPAPDPVRQKVEAIRELTRAERWAQVDAELAAMAVDDAAWERVASVIYEAGISRKDLPWVLGSLSRVTESPRPSIKAAALIVVGRVYRRQGDTAAAARAMEAAKAAAPDTRYAEEAGGLLYEITHLSPGMPAPAIAAKARNAGTIRLAALRGKPVVLVFWGTT